MRAGRRVAPDRALQAREVRSRLTLTKVRTDVLERAVQTDPALLRSLDAIQLASALDLGDDLESVVTYDERLADACEAHVT